MKNVLTSCETILGRMEKPHEEIKRLNKVQLSYQFTPPSYKDFQR